jgi:Protein of unknown function (DUF2934)
MKQTSPAALPRQTTNATKSAPDLQEQIRLRAYGLYEQRGREGNELDDWLQAESDVTQPRTKTLIP